MCANISLRTAFTSFIYPSSNNRQYLPTRSTGYGQKLDFSFNLRHCSKMVTRMWQECSLCRRRGDMIDSHSSRKRRGRVCIKARRDRKAERGPIAIQSSSFFSSFHWETPLFTALRCSCAAALPPSPRRDSPPSTARLPSPLARRAPPLGSGSRARRSAPRRAAPRHTALLCTVLHRRRELHADARAFLRIASSSPSPRSDAYECTSNLTPRGAPGLRPPACCSFSRN